MNKEQKELIDLYLSQASPEEAAELKKLLNKRAPGQLSQININDAAKKMANDLQENMGLTQKSITKMARELVIDLALQYNPNMSNKEIQALINELVPQKKKKAAKLPRDIIIEMCRHIIEYNEGIMEKRTLSQLPDDWVNKYLNSLPEDIYNVMNGYLQEKISIEECWKAVKALA